ncbi:MAG: serpin family protein [Candidatus Protochlamydia sp.]|nr:serpin family protein [Candidatus Protochlamydia sp.]
MIKISAIEEGRQDFFKDQHFNMVIQGNNQFGFNLLKKLNGRQGNLYFSSYSIASGLARLYIAARNETANEMQRVLKYTPAFSPLIGTLDNFFLTALPLKNSTRLFLASGVWLQEGVPVIPAYQFGLERDFNSKAETIDFKKGFINSIRTINQAVAKQTENQISQILTTQDITDQTQLIITTAFAVKGGWLYPFDRKDTQKTAFHLNEKQTRQVEMMYGTLECPCFRSENLNLIEIPLKPPEGSQIRLSLFILLPKEKMGWKTISSELSIENWDKWESGLKSQLVYLGLPRFRLEDRLNLNIILQSLGMKQAFDQNADFTGMSEAKGLKLSNVAHKTLLKIDEKGIESTRINQTGPAQNLDNTEAIKFLIDHPFYIFLVDRASGSILSIGRVLQP